MKTVVICDDDVLVGQLALERCEVLLSLGDIYPASIEKAWELYRPEVAFGVYGNHDGSEPLPAFMEPLHCQTVVFKGLTFGGFDGSWRYKRRGYHMYEQEEVTRLLADFPPVDVFVAHNSPRGVHERDSDVHQGFDAFRDYIERCQPAFFLHGHQHLTRSSTIGKTRVIGCFGESEIEL